MNRTDRLYALREELRRAGPAGRTAERLAEVFEVSTRTIKRDIAALQQGGFPVWARPGPGGGYVVDKAATLPPINFTDAEVAGLAAAVAAHRGQPFDGYARAALVKALSVMDTQARKRATLVNDRVWIDYTDPPSDARIRRTVERALHERRVLVVDDVRVDPVFLARTDGSWFLVGRAGGVIKWFRLESITAARLTREPSVVIPVEEIGIPPVTAKASADF
ncbi:helix-turn-helix transcriptional regulator [Paractinoplanes lichenicola]|uniref:HTH domain-containing protein n=1 Tax=Paractinoplanes lichenicola TaxID=2802976 RepID=A0ABS1VDP8_9ACTN|nr:HTH domain-containing protein [Actinoplanes lichenicola]MBL7252802.1 HTH domain-containing protein [Actinoplanes lichenicola]